MNLLANVEEAIEGSIREVVEARAAVIDLDVSRIGGDVSTIANKLGELMEGLKNHKEVIQNLATQHHALVSALNNKTNRLPWPSLKRQFRVGPN